MRAEILQLCRQYGLSRAYLFKILHMLRSLFVPQRRQTFLSIPSANLGTPDSPRTNLSTPDSPRTNLSALYSLRTNLSTPDSPRTNLSTPDSPCTNLSAVDSPRTNLSTPDSPRTNLSALDSPRTNLSALDSAGADILVSVDDIDSFCFSLKRLCVCLLDVIVNQRLLSLLMDLIPLNLQLVDLKSLCPIILRARLVHSAKMKQLFFLSTIQ